MALEIFFSTVNFSSKGNYWDGSIFPVVPLLFTQLIHFKTPVAQYSVICNNPPFFFNNIRLVFTWVDFFFIFNN